MSRSRKTSCTCSEDDLSSLRGPDRRERTYFDGYNARSSSSLEGFIFYRISQEETRREGERTRGTSSSGRRSSSSRVRGKRGSGSRSSSTGGSGSRTRRTDRRTGSSRSRSKCSRSSRSRGSSSSTRRIIRRGTVSPFLLLYFI